MMSDFVCSEKYYGKHATTKFGNSPRLGKYGKIGGKYPSISDEGWLFGSLSSSFGTKKVCSMKNTLNNLQNDFLREFFSRENHFYLTGGAALAGFYFGHRKTEDLDLFTLENEIENGFAIVREVAQTLSAKVESIQTSPDFRRLLVKRGDEAVVVDLIREYVFQLEREKREINGIRIDSPEEIMANKLCTLLSRAEIRDLVDVRELEKAGFDLEDALAAAQKKDTGLSPGQLAWILDQIKLGDNLIPTGSLPVAELREYLIDLTSRLKRLAFPTIGL